MSDLKKSIKPMEYYNMSDFLKGYASQIITKVSEEDIAGYVLKHGEPKVVIFPTIATSALKKNTDVNEY